MTGRVTAAFIHRRPGLPGQFVLMGLLLSATAPTAAHELPMAAITLTPGDDGQVVVRTKTPMRGGDYPSPLTLTLDPACESTASRSSTVVERSVIQQWTLRCASPVSGRALRINGLDTTVPEAMVHWLPTNGGERFYRVHRLQPTVTLDAAGDRVPGLGAYFGIGVEHIVFGPDHLLFVLGLVLLIRGSGNDARRLLVTVTAFTVAHSITLGAATLWGVSLPARAVEATIALSILLLAFELAHKPRRIATQTPTLAMRHPAAVAFAFGLLHGFGFAGALAEIGLPETSRAWALGLFNLGVEAGQLLFVAAVLALLALARGVRLDARLDVRLVRASTHAIGGVAAFWLIQRLSAITLA